MRKVGNLKELFSFLKEYISNKIFDKDDEYILIIKKKKKTRTLPQNKMFHTLFNIISDEEIKLGNKENSPEHIKYIMKCGLLGTKEITVGKITVPYPKKGTSDLSDKEGIDFIEKMILWCNTKYDLKITSREDERLLEYYDKYLQ